MANPYRRLFDCVEGWSTRLRPNRLRHRTSGRCGF